MNKTKRRLQLVSAIISIIIGAITVISCIVLMATIGAIMDAGSTMDPAFAEMINQVGKSFVYAVLILAMIFAIALIVCGSLMCPNPDKKNTEYKGLTITLLVLNCLLLLSSIANLTDASGILSLLLCLANVGLLIAVLCIKSEPAKTEQTQQVNEGYVPQNDFEYEAQPVQQNVVKPAMRATGNNKIDAIRKLHEDGVISEEEMKTLIMKELDK